jgi:hypothetical protein
MTGLGGAEEGLGRRHVAVLAQHGAPRATAAKGRAKLRATVSVFRVNGFALAAARHEINAGAPETRGRPRLRQAPADLR